MEQVAALDSVALKICSDIFGSFFGGGFGGRRRRASLHGPRKGKSPVSCRCALISWMRSLVKPKTITIGSGSADASECMGSGARSKADVQSCSQDVVAAGHGTLSSLAYTICCIPITNTVCPDCNGSGRQSHSPQVPKMSWQRL